MNWYKISQNVTKTARRPWGYWLSPTGELTPVQSESEHWDVGVELLGVPRDQEEKLLDMYNGEGDPYVLLFQKGWIRITSDAMLAVQYKTIPTPAQSKTIIELGEDLGLISSNFVRGIYVNDNKQPTSLIELKRLLNGEVSNIYAGLNWYSLLKQAQIWSTNNDNTDFIGMLSDVYELEYKYSIMKTRPFSGMERRRDKMLEALREELQESLVIAKGVLERTLKGWLSSHAITEPGEWANARTNDDYDMWEADPTTSFQGVLGEFARYKYPQRYNQGPNNDSVFRDMLQEIIPHFNNMPALNQFLQYSLEGRKEMLHDELSYGIEDFNESNGMQFTDEDQAYEWVENLTVEDMGLQHEMSDYYDYDRFYAEAEQLGLLQGIAKEFYQFAVFPLWYEFWSQQGIDDTRETAEDVYNILVGANSVEELSSAVNLAIGTVHQNGQMIEYVETYGGIDLGADVQTVQGWLKEQTNNLGEDWNEELREVGVQI